MLTIGNGVRLAAWSSPCASSWLVAAAALAFALALKLTTRLDATAGLVLGGAAAVSATFCFVIGARLKRARQAVLDGSDGAETERLLREARVQRLARRQRARRGTGWRRHVHFAGLDR